jgi:hypothetical protein
MIFYRVEVAGLTHGRRFAANSAVDTIFIRHEEKEPDQLGGAECPKV